MGAWGVYETHPGAYRRFASETAVNWGMGVLLGKQRDHTEGTMKHREKGFHGGLCRLLRERDHESAADAGYVSGRSATAPQPAASCARSLARESAGKLS